MLAEVSKEETACGYHCLNGMSANVARDASSPVTTDRFLLSDAPSQTERLYL